MKGLANELGSALLVNTFIENNFLTSSFSIPCVSERYFLNLCILIA